MKNGASFSFEETQPRLEALAFISHSVGCPRPNPQPAARYRIDVRTGTVHGIRYGEAMLSVESVLIDFACYSIH